MTRPQNLFALQQMDNEIDNRLNNIARIDMTLNESEPVRHANQQIAEAEKALRTATSHQKDLQYSAEETTTHADTLEKRLYGGEIKGAKESEAAQTEIATFRARRKDLDDKLVAVMDLVTIRQTELQQAQAHLADVQAEMQETHAALHTEREKLESELPDLRAERDKRRQTIVTPDIILYDKLRDTKNGLAVVQVENSAKICGKCRVDLPAAKIKDIKAGTAVVTCPSCGRILFFK